MKKNKKKTETAYSPESDLISRRTRRQKETLERERLKNERNRNTVFKKRVNDASVQKVPKTLRTKAYYRFSKSYPSVVDHEGFRENKTGREKLSKKGCIILLMSCICVFTVTLFAVLLGIELSDKNTPPSENISSETAAGGINAKKITDEYFIENTAAQIKDSLSGTALLIDVKNEDGFVHMANNTYKSSSSSAEIEKLKEKLAELEAAGIKTVAYISCFKDSVKPIEYSGMEIMTSSGELFKDSEGALWLNPFSSAAQDYILSVIESAADSGFSYILLDNVCFPTAFSVSAPYYQNSPDINAKSNTLKSFINKAVRAVGNEKLIINCDITGFCNISELPNDKYGRTLLGTDCISFCLDLRSSKQYTEQLKNSEHFRYIEEMPLAFVLDAGILAREELVKNKEAYVLFAVSDDEDTRTADYIAKAGIENIILTNN